MPLTTEDLAANYFYACLYIAGPPYKFSRKDIKIFDDGLSSSPAPYIGKWEVVNIPMPSNSEMMNNVSMDNINGIKALMGM